MVEPHFAGKFEKVSKSRSPHRGGQYYGEYLKGLEHAHISLFVETTARFSSKRIATFKTLNFGKFRFVSQGTFCTGSNLYAHGPLVHHIHSAMAQLRPVSLKWPSTYSSTISLAVS